MGYATYFGYKHGKVNKLTSPIDGGLNFCGFGEMEGYDKMILTDFKVTLGPNILRSGVCIKECPHEGGIELKEGVNCKSNSNVKCKKKKTYKTRDAFDFCLPMDKGALSAESAEGYDYLMKMLEDSPAGMVFEDMYKSSTSMYISMGCALVWSIVYIYFMSMFAE